MRRGGRGVRRRLTTRTTQTARRRPGHDDGAQVPLLQGWDVGCLEVPGCEDVGVHHGARTIPLVTDRSPDLPEERGRCDVAPRARFRHAEFQIISQARQ
eukprot:4599989-Pyramimonas_sp.AAC.1